MPRKGKRRYSRMLVLDPYLTYAVFAGLGLATWRLDQLLRLTLSWLALLAFTLIYGSGKRIEVAYGFSNVGRGALAGLLVSLPILLLARDLFLVVSQRLFPTDGTLMRFWALVLIMPAVETLYFRGFVQREKGVRAAVLLYAAAGAVYFVPSTLWDYLLVLAALIAGMGLLGFVYSYVRALHGFSASLACQATVHSVVFILPLLPLEFARLLA